MKRLSIFILVLSVLVSCRQEEFVSKTGRILEGKHELRRFKISTKEGYTWSASYFLIAGSGGGRTYKDSKASFSWKMNTGEYAISEIEVSEYFNNLAPVSIFIRLIYEPKGSPKYAFISL